jgi:hypothetical protein
VSAPDVAPLALALRPFFYYYCDYNCKHKQMESSSPSLCALIEEMHLKVVNSALSSPPSAVSVISMTLQFLREHRARLLSAFSSCAWTFAVCPREPQPCFERSLNHVMHTLQTILARLTASPNNGDAWASDAQLLRQARDTWIRFYTSISTGCCTKLPNGDMGARYVIRLTPNIPPFDGQLACIPTLTPAKLTERSYADRRQCELALSLLPRDNVAMVDQVHCNEYGCYRVPLSTHSPQTMYGRRRRGDGCFK